MGEVFAHFGASLWVRARVLRCITPKRSNSPGRHSITTFVAIAVFCLGTLVPAAASAEVVTPYRAQLSLHGIEGALRPSRPAPEREAISAVRIKGRVFAAGNVFVHLGTRRNKTWSSSITRNGVVVEDNTVPVLLQGRISLGGGLKTRGRRVMPSAAYVVGDTLKVSFPGRAKGSRGSRQRIYTITMKLDGSLVIDSKVSSIPRAALRKKGCATSASSSAAALSEAGAGAVVRPLGEGDSGSTETARVVTISTDADPEWYALYGGASNSHIAGLLYTAEGIYARQLGIRFRLVKQHAYADAAPYTTTEPLRLLKSFVANPANPTNLSDSASSFNQDVDLKHLFSGKDVDGSVIGIAYIGVVCSSPALAYGITSHYADAADYAILAHEIGHNFGAGHDAENRGSLMYPSISVPAATAFSGDSLTEVNSHIGRYGSCLSVEQVTPRPDVTPGFPTPPPNNVPDISSATIKIAKGRVGNPRSPVVRIRGSVISAAGVPIPGVPIRLFAAAEPVGEAVTEANGEFRFFVRLVLPKDRQIYLWAETLDGYNFSNFIWLGTTQPR